MSCKSLTTWDRIVINEKILNKDPCIEQWFQNIRWITQRMSLPFMAYPHASVISPMDLAWSFSTTSAIRNLGLFDADVSLFQRPTIAFPDSGATRTRTWEVGHFAKPLSLALLSLSLFSHYCFPKYDLTQLSRELSKVELFPPSCQPLLPFTGAAVFQGLTEFLQPRWLL